ncbi:ISAs1 family transposase [Azonexus hydrophilus]|uniref:ISAs1 family transposase n=1 Tax=Azonexus hydrophilus TaxID=418702 RepID=UPI00176BEA92|nr:ISAs1 family transposase [Azonexus hydrophilus]HHV49424.1 ISAs1 family transposase [Rhodocyclaceae bacterium]
MTLTEAFSDLPDPRTGPAQRHDLTEMILMALCAVLCGADSWVDVAEWAEDNEAWIKRYLVLEHGTPSHDTFSRVFRLLDAKVFEACFREWIGSLVGAVTGVVAIDGKTASGSKDGHNTALHTISAYATASGLCLAQEHTRGKGNEIPAIKALLDTLALKGCIVTIDAIGCQTEIAQKILDRGGDYLLAVKDNQETLANAWREFFAEGEAAGFGSLPVSRYQSIEKDHGRIETRQALWVTDLSWLDKPPRQHWPRLAGIGMIERQREINGKTSYERAFYIGSKGIASAESFAKAARSHWGIENSLHWVLDVIFRKDDCRVRKDHAPHNFAALRKFALALLRQDTQYPKRSLRSRRKTAERLPDYRAALLGLVPRG